MARVSRRDTLGDRRVGHRAGRPHSLQILTLGDPGAASSVRTVADPPFVPTDFAPPTTLVREHFRLEPLGPQHNEADHTAWTSSIAHVRSTPGFPDGNWPPL